MRTASVNRIVTFICILALLGAGWQYRNEITEFVRHELVQYKPCVQPITYSIGAFDTRFNISKATFQNDIAKAEKIWETAIGRDLFQYTEDGEVSVRLVYDERQQATDTLRKLGITLSGDRASYDAVKSTYDSLKKEYEQKKAALTVLIRAFETEKSAYEKEVSYWNSRGGAPEKEYKIIVQKKSALDVQVAAINRAQDALNKLADEINASVAVMNRLADEFNITVRAYNTVGASNGEEFNEGIYVRDESGESITIYQFDNEDKLVRVLAHELGHALGLPHVDDPKAIMYRLNQATNAKPTPADITALKNACGISADPKTP